MTIHSMFRLILGLLLSTFIPGLAWAETIRGLLVYGHETRTLQPCGRDQRLWVIAKGDLHRQLQQRYLQLVRKPYEPVYAELEGDFTGMGKGEFGKPYAGVFTITHLLTLSAGEVKACHQGNPPPSVVQTYVFECEDQSTYVVRTRPDGAWIFLPQGSSRLSPAPADHGDRYTGGDFEISIQGESAQIQEPGQTPKRCRNNPRRAVWERAKLDGADFRAVGNEPGWDLVIIDGRIVLNTDYGTTRIEVPLPKPVIDQKSRTTVWKTQPLTLEVIGRPCSDTMADEHYESTVTVRLPNQTLRGCGMALH